MPGTPPQNSRKGIGTSHARRLIAGAGVSLVLLSAGFAWAAAEATPDHTAPAPSEAPFELVSDVTGGTSPADARPASPEASLALPVPSELAADPARAASVLRQECDPYYAMEPEPTPHRNFYFARGMYSSGNWGYYGRSWRTDFPKADRQFAYVMERTLGWDIYPCETPVGLDDPQLRRYPFLYLLEVGGMGLRDEEIEGLREYLLAGGFAFIDDFWGPYEWANFEREIRRVLPEHQIVELPADHLIFRIVYPIEEVLQVPNRSNGRRGDPRGYGECGGPCPATIRGIFDEDGRLMVLIAHNTDLGDAWEWAEDPYYPYDRSNYAFSLAFNAITYAMTY